MAGGHVERVRFPPARKWYYAKMHEKLNESLEFREKCAALAERLWARDAREEILSYGHTLFPAAKKEYVQALLGKSVISQGRFVYEYFARKNIKNPDTKKPYSREDFLDLYRKRCDREASPTK